MKEITNILKSKQFLMGLGIGFAGYWAYNKYMKKEPTSSASGQSSSGGKCTNPKYVTCNYVSTSGECGYGCVPPQACSSCNFGEVGLGTNYWDSSVKINKR